MGKKLLQLLFIFAVTPIWSQNPIGFAPTTDISGIYFGNVVDIDGDEIISATQSQVNLADFGKVYIFGVNGSEIQQKQVLAPDDSTGIDAFGFSISIDNEFIAVGAPAQDAIATDAGAVYIYRKINAQYEFFQKLTVADGSIQDYFGSHVKVYNDNLFIAANGYGLDESFGSGAVYVYHFDGTTWVFAEQLTAPDTNAFGRKIDVNGDTLVISSDQIVNSIHTFHWDGTHWAFSNSMSAPNEGYFSDFSLANNELYLLTSVDSEPAVVTIFSDSGSNWTQQSAVNPANGSLMLTAIEIDGDHMYLGGNTDWSGLLIRYPVFHYLKNGANWDSQPSLYGTTASTTESDSFGFAIASKNGKLVVGAPFETSLLSYGKAYYFDTTLSTYSFDRKSIAVSPNPTSNILNVTSKTDISQWNVYDISGKLLLSKPGNSKEISVNHLANGIYFVRIQTNDGDEETFKIIKN